MTSPAAPSGTFASGGDDDLRVERCPWCEQPITHGKFQEMKARIEADERKRTAEDEKRHEAELAQARRKAAAEAEVRAQAAAEEAKRTAEIANAEKIAELETARAVAEEQVASHNENLRELRTALEKDRADAVNAERARAFQDQQRIQDRVDYLQRALDKKTAEELGEGAEVDLFETLKEAFPDDHITRVAKGKEGADIIHRIRDGGRECGVIVYDSKNRTAWRTAYVEKLRKDQLALKADHAVLSTMAFPAGYRQICLQESVILCNPARAVVIVDLLRRQLIHTHTMRLSAEARSEKTAMLYDFITSEHYAHLVEQAEQRAEQILDLDVAEKKAHELMWKKRGELVIAIQRALLDTSSEIDAIIGGKSLIRAVK
jgi:hypothetical protein